MSARFSGLQQLGRALMLPIAVLPIAGLLLRLGQPDVLNLSVMAAAGDAIFSNLGMLFAVGVAVGLARENHGAAGLAALVGVLVTTHGIEVMMAVPPDLKARELSKLSIPVGLICGITAGLAYNRFANITLPSSLSFFGGRRFVPILTGVAGVAYAVVIGLAWPIVEHGMDAASRGILGAGNLGLFVYGVLNRTLIITGLHHILNNFAWFIVGDFNGATGDLKRFFAGDPTAGAFMSGFFPVMMFGLPGACLAMYHAARSDRRAEVSGLLLSIALTSFLTGVTEPIEFTFMFLAPVLYALHAIATGAAMVLMNVLHVRLGFSFSAGLFDYVLNFSHAQHPLWLLPIGAVYFALYYGVFYLCIVKLNLATPGRGAEESAAADSSSRSPHDRAGGFVEALGGTRNLQEVEACTTRLRIIVADGAAVNEAALKRLGARGIVRPAPGSVQVVLGPIADQVAGEIRGALRFASGASAAALPSGHDAKALLDSLGGRTNVRELAVAPGRLLLQLVRLEAVNDAALAALGLRGVARPGDDRLQLLVAGAVEATAQPLGALLRE